MAPIMTGKCKLTFCVNNIFISTTLETEIQYKLFSKIQSSKVLENKKVLPNSEEVYSYRFYSIQ